jgi:hypothetical protein
VFQAAWALVGLVCLGFVLWRVAWLILAADPALAIAGYAFFIVLLVLRFWRLYVGLWTTDRWRNDPSVCPSVWQTGLVFPPHTRVHPVVDGLFTVLLVWLLATTVFGLATTFLDNASLAGSGRELSEQGRFYLAGELYLWHLLDMTLPFIGATDTLNWKEPVARYSGATGALLVVFKLLVVAPGGVFARRKWKARATAEDESSAE